MDMPTRRDEWVFAILKSILNVTYDKMNVAGPEIASEIVRPLVKSK
jgi:hypothetical protein